MREPHPSIWRRLLRLVPHTYILMAPGTLFAGATVWQLVRLGDRIHQSWLIFLAGVIGCAWLGLVAGILMYAPRDHL